MPQHGLPTTTMSSSTGDREGDTDSLQSSDRHRVSVSSGDSGVARRMALQVVGDGPARPQGPEVDAALMVGTLPSLQHQGSCGRKCSGPWCTGRRA